jgi:NAD(P)-dependent dehydrogenase (short-subunit alcohol dehydrogenase family)
MIAPVSRSVVLAGSDNFAADEILAKLCSNGLRVAATRGLEREDVALALATAGDADALVIVLPQPAMGKMFLDIDDDALEASMEQAIDLIRAVGAGLEALPDRGSIVVVGNRGYLGGWGGAHEMALSGMIGGFVRSVALAAMPRSIRANMVALDLPGRAPVEPSSAAALAAFLASPESEFVNGEVVLANRGRSMQLREARERV